MSLSVNDAITQGLHGIVYKLSCGDACYIGSTLRPLRRRLQDHKEKYKNGKNRLYEFIRNVGWNNMKVEVLEEKQFKTRVELRTREKYFYDLLKPSLNEISPYLSREDKKTLASLRWKKWYYDPKRYELEKSKKRKMYHDNAAYYKEKLDCECGRLVSRKYMPEHLKSVIHRQYIQRQNKLKEEKRKQQLEQEVIEEEIKELEEKYLQNHGHHFKGFNLNEEILACDEMEEVNLDELFI